jgi:hypothetical protein
MAAVEMLETFLKRWRTKCEVVLGPLMKYASLFPSFATQLKITG